MSLVIVILSYEINKHRVNQLYNAVINIEKDIVNNKDNSKLNRK